MDNVRGTLKIKVLLTGTLGRDRSRRRRLKNLKTTERRGSGNLRVQRNLKNWKRKSPSRKEFLFYTLCSFLCQRPRLNLRFQSYGWNLIPSLGGKIRVGTDASFNTERTWTVHHSSAYYHQSGHNTSKINPVGSGNSCLIDTVQECQKSFSPRVRDNTFEGAKCSIHFPRLTKIGQWIPRVTNSDR